jgi:hypothetical protein
MRRPSRLPTRFHRRDGALWVDPFRDFHQCPGFVEQLSTTGDGGK